MRWRVWSLLAGAPVGALAAWALGGPSRLGLQVGAAAGGLALLAIVLGIARRHDDPARGAHLAAASSIGLLALPALVACALRLAPGPAWWLTGVIAALAIALCRAAFQRGPAGGVGRQLGVAVAVLVGGTGVGTLVSAGIAALGSTDPIFNEQRAIAVYDVDARVVTRPIPRCAPEPASVIQLLDRGARPRLSRDARAVWFDTAVDGRRQVHRLERATGEVVCWTCDEPGNNLRPFPGHRAAGVLFETDRHATLWDPTNTELHLLSGRGDAPRWPSRRITYRPGPDDHAIFAPTGAVVVWSQRRGGRYQVVSAQLRSAHGGLDLGREGLLAGGGAGWTAPLGWSPDGRSLVVVRGNPMRPLPGAGIDFGTRRISPLGDDIAGAGAAAFNADGGWLVVASARRARFAGLLPAQLGFLLAPLAAAVERDGNLYRTTRLRVGESWGPGAQLELGALADWGAPTGVALAPGEPAIVLSQRRVENGASQERLVEIRLDCSP